MLFDSERQAFSDLLDEIGEHYGRVVSGATKMTWWRLLANQLDLETLRQVLDRHLLDAERGRFFPQPSDVLALVERLQGGRPGADEAWALALESFDEAVTVCVTDEILMAVQAAAPVWAIGDGIGARMAFKTAYERLVAEHRLLGRRPQWQLSLGWDAARRTAVVQRAVASGRLSRDQVGHLLPPPEVSAQIPTSAESGETQPALALDRTNVRRQWLQRIHEAIQRGAPPPAVERRENRAARERERFDQLKRDALAKLERRCNTPADVTAPTNGSETG